VSNWKLLTSSTNKSAAPARQEGDHGGADIAAHQGFQARGGEQLPQQGGGGGLAVGATYRQERPPDEGAATSSSPTTGRPAARAAMSQGSSGGTPGTGRWHQSPASGSGHAQVFHHPQALDVPAGVARSSGGAWSVDRHPGPCSTRKRHRATPVRARPTTKIFLFSKSIEIPCTYEKAGAKGADAKRGKGKNQKLQ